MRLMRSLRLLPWLALALTGCGTAGADLMVVDRSGSIAGATLAMRVIDDGQVVCNGSKHPLASQALIDAREVVRQLGEPGTKGLVLRPGTPSILRFSIRTKDGVVRFSDTSPGQPAVFYKAAQLIRTIAKEDCGLAR